MKTLDEIKKTMSSGDTDKAAESLKELLAKEPGNLQAKMLYGTCCQLLGDEETFSRIHDELAPVMEKFEKSEPQAETVSLWRKYHALWMSLIVGGLVLAGLTGAAWYFGNDIKGQFATLYGGPEQVPRYIRSEDSHVRFVEQLYAGPPRSGLEVDSIKTFSDSDRGFKP